MKRVTLKFHPSKGLIICIIYFVNNGAGPNTCREEIDLKKKRRWLGCHYFTMSVLVSLSCM